MDQQISLRPIIKKKNKKIIFFQKSYIEFFQRNETSFYHVFWQYVFNILTLFIYLFLFYFWASLAAQMVKNLLPCRRCVFNPWVRKIAFRREWLPTPVFLPGKCHGQRSLASCSPWGLKESDTRDWATNTFTFWPCGRWDLSSLTRDHTHTFCSGSTES